MNRMRGWYIAAVTITAAGATCGWAGSSLGFQGYLAVADGLSGEAKVFGQRIVHQAYDTRLSDSVAKIPIISLQYAGVQDRQGPADDPSHVEARAKSVAERLAHAWTLMDHGAKLEIGDDDWNAYRVSPQPAPPKHLAIFVRSPVASGEPLRSLTIYPQDVAGYPWVGGERSLAEYWATLIQAHYLVFWKHESNPDRYRELRLDRTAEGRVFRNIAARATELARRKGRERFDSGMVKEVLAGMTLTQRETLYRLATVPPMDWEPAAR